MASVKVRGLGFCCSWYGVIVTFRLLLAVLGRRTVKIMGVCGGGGGGHGYLMNFCFLKRMSQSSSEVK